MTPPLRKALLVVHGVVTLAAAIVLALFPDVIPGTVGIMLTPQGVLLAYLLAGAELGIALISLGAVRLVDAAALRIVLSTFAVFHLATAVLETVYLAHAPVERVLVANIVVRGVAAALFLFALRGVHVQGT